LQQLKGKEEEEKSQPIDQWFALVSRFTSEGLFAVFAVHP